VLVWLVLRQLRVPGAWVGAAVFALHPMNVESVAWITERKNVLSGLFALGALLVYLRGEAAETAHGNRTQWRPYLAACVLFIAALFSKTATSPLPAVLLILAWGRGTLDRRTWWKTAPLFLAGLVMACVTAWVEQHYVRAVGEEWTLSPVGTLVAGRVLWFYPRTLLWPSALTFVYPRWSIDADVWWQYLFPAVSLAMIGGLYANRRRIGTGPVVAVFCYVALLVPAMGFFHVYFMRYSFVADHFAYLAAIPLIALVTAGGTVLATRAGRAGHLIAPVAWTLVLAALAVMAARQCGIYHDLHTLWADTLSKNPTCWLAHNNLGVVMETEGRIDEAFDHYTQAVRWKPDYVEAHINLGNAWRTRGKLDAAVGEYTEALRLQPTSATADNNLGIALETQGKTPDAIARYTEALRWRPDYPEAHYNLAMALAAQGKSDEATSHFQQALRGKSDSVEARYRFGMTLAAQGRTDDAVAQLEETLRQKPDFAEAHYNLAGQLRTLGRTAEAIAHLEEAVRWRPDFPEAHNNLGATLAAQGNMPAAIAHLEQALRLQPTYADAHRNLGMAFAADGQTKRAAAELQQALQLNPDDTDSREQLGQLEQPQRGTRE